MRRLKDKKTTKGKNATGAMGRREPTLRSCIQATLQPSRCLRGKSRICIIIVVAITTKGIHCLSERAASKLTHPVEPSSIHEVSKICERTEKVETFGPGCGLKVYVLLSGAKGRTEWPLPAGAGFFVITGSFQTITRTNIQLVRAQRLP